MAPEVAAVERKGGYDFKCELSHKFYYCVMYP